MRHGTVMYLRSLQYGVTQLKRVSVDERAKDCYCLVENYVMERVVISVRPCSVCVSI